MKRLLSLALALLVLGGCAYYNTFYSAKKNWADAMLERQHNPLDVPSATEMNLYGACIKSCTSLITRYPKSKYVDDAVLLMAKCYLARADYEQAISEFQLLVDSLPKSDLIPDARLGQAQAYSKLRKFTDADSAFTGALRIAPDFPRKDELLLAWGDSKRDERKSRDALLYYTRLFQECPESDLRYLARTHRGEAFFQLEEWDSARVEFEAVSRDAPKPEDRYQAAMQVGEAYENANQYDKAIAYYRLQVPDATRLGHPDELDLRIAGAQLGHGEVDKAVDSYIHIRDTNLTNKFGSAAAYQLGYIYETYKEDFEQARKSYDQVAQLPRSEFTDLARDRNQGLAQAADLKKRQNETKGHFDDKAEAAYQLGELYFFQTKSPAKAAEQWFAVERRYGYTRFGPKAAYSAAWALDHMKDTTAAESAFARTAARYSRTDFGDAAADTLRNRHPNLIDSLLALGRRDTTNLPLPRPPEAIADSIQQAAFADSVRKVHLADSVRAVARSDSLEKLATRAAFVADSLKALQGKSPGAAAADSLRRGSATPPGDRRIQAVPAPPDSSKSGLKSGPPGSQPPPAGGIPPHGPAPPDSGGVKPPPPKGGGAPPDSGGVKPAPPQSPAPADSSKGQGGEEPPPPVAAPADTSRQGHR